MNLTKLFEAQKALDERITKEKGLHGQDLLHKKILAFNAELMECANEWRGFKYWSEDQEPRTSFIHECPDCVEGSGWAYQNVEIEGPEGLDYHSVGFKCPTCKGTGGAGETNPLLEEYADVVHFALSLNLYVWNGNPGTVNAMPRVFDTIEQQFIEIGGEAYKLYENADVFMHSGLLLANVLGLGQVLGFTEDQIEAAYFAKNRTNHKRQATGY
ncbi:MULTISPECIES: dUTP diphosphatase [Bhargavaea]|uniref:dUTP diphosphatase n=1 Tax=Bhargavaea changchunensis TaxID=2134037 RepID=A0ABW2NB70_9BACL|nr:dUTP diphosphatase [Bhargavaea sp. CC-171006]